MPHRLINETFPPQPCGSYWTGAVGLTMNAESYRATRPGAIVGDVNHWVETIARFALEHRQDTFTFWPLAGDEVALV